MASGRKCYVEVTPGWYITLSEKTDWKFSVTTSLADAYIFLSAAKARKYKDYNTRNGKVKALDGKRVRQ